MISDLVAGRREATRHAKLTNHALVAEVPGIVAPGGIVGDSYAACRRSSQALWRQALEEWRVIRSEPSFGANQRIGSYTVNRRRRIA